MTPELQEYYESLIDMFATKGWAETLEDFKEARESIKIENLKTESEFWIAKGKVDILDRVLGYETLIKDSYDLQVENAEDS